MSVSFSLPVWFNRFISKPTEEGLEQRTALTGTAKRTHSYLSGLIEIEITASAPEQSSTPNQSNCK